MKKTKLTALILALLMFFALPLQATPLQAATAGDTGVRTPLYEDEPQPAPTTSEQKEIVIYYQATNGSDIHAKKYVKAATDSIVNLSDYVLEIATFKHVGYRPADAKVTVVRRPGPTENQGIIIYEKVVTPPKDSQEYEIPKGVSDPNAPSTTNQPVPVPPVTKPPVTTEPTEDVSKVKPAYPETRINTAEKQTLTFITGYPDQTMRPLNPVTREEVATIFYAVLDPELKTLLHPEIAVLNDVSPSDWSYKQVGSLVVGDIMLPRDGNNFRPKAFATRDEVAQVLAAFLPGNATPASANMFNDIAASPQRDSILKVANTGWVKGYEDGSFRPDNTINRAELITVVNNLLDRTIKPPVKDLPFKDVYVHNWFYNSIATAVFGNMN